MAEKFSYNTFDTHIFRSMVVQSLIIFLVVYLSYSFLSGVFISDSNWFWVIMGVFVLYEALPFIGKKFEFITHNVVSLSMVLALFAALTVFYVPVGHPLELIGFPIVAIAAHRLSLNKLTMTLMLIALVYFAAYYYQSGISALSASELLIKIVMVAATAALAHVYSSNDMKERERLANLSEDMEYERIRLQSLINSMADAVIAFDGEGKVQLYNGAALGLLNTNETLNDKKLNKYITFIDDEENEVDLLSEAMESLRIIQRSDLRFINNENEKINLYVDLAPVRLQGTRVDGFIILLRDITKEKSIEEQRDDFISIVSHELRTPIAITEGNISTAMLPSIKSNKKRMELMGQAHKNILFLANLVNDITTLAHAERGDLDTEMIGLKPEDLANDLHSNYKDPAKEEGLTLKLELEKNLPKVKTSENRLREILQDFITNAIKYTDKGSVTIKVAKISPNVVRFSILDTGIGIGTTDRKKVFEKFYRAENYQTREHSGTGLGLYIARKLAELIGAKVGVNSRLNEGSEFYVDVPTV